MIDLVLVVKPSGKVGSAKAINLYYQAGGTHYLFHYPYGLKISVTSTCQQVAAVSAPGGG